MTLHYDDEILYSWTCPKCNTSQIDDYAWTSIVQCSECEFEWHWEDVVTPDEMRRLNKEFEATMAEEAYLAEQDKAA